MPHDNPPGCLASMVDSSHVTLEGSSRPRKQPLSEMELPLKREETARKRKNLSEKKLEDEKAEMINRLLKKQTRPRARRMGTADSPFPRSSTPIGVPVPTMYRWVSSVVDVDVDAGGGPPNANPDVKTSDKHKDNETAVADENAMDVENDKSAPGRVERKIVMSFSVPARQLELGAGVPMDVEGGGGVPGRGPGVCAVEGCGGKRKYRCLKDWTVGACGMAHLKVLETRWVGS
ncbi:hypothetical protein FA15DRAFT_601369 [Coprinopsis marcescibilis]|uniref:INO80 complex subunit B-like conserved region domain-containing protein n=1 Tax=Coprinopsis marcescibilis TaxID=230819 RepID=A0A5C3KH50_COPMA|nr:hypothetical protein FA15DRAFT_601369 [Coprinopsis marcescibilis]